MSLLNVNTKYNDFHSSLHYPMRCVYSCVQCSLDLFSDIFITLRLGGSSKQAAIDVPVSNDCDVTVARSFFNARLTLCLVRPTAPSASFSV